jgi:hypothetical protein
LIYNFNKTNLSLKTPKPIMKKTNFYFRCDHVAFYMWQRTTLPREMPAAPGSGSGIPPHHVQLHLPGIMEMEPVKVMLNQAIFYPGAADRAYFDK